MILSVKGVNKSYGKEKVLQDISFEIEQPQVVALVGPNGSGKSTLLSIITNLVKADQGEVKILNKSNKDPEIFREISFMQDNSVLYDYLTGYDHLQFIADVQSISKEQVIETAEKIGMDSYLNKKVGKYSLGMKQHLLITMAVVNRPKLLLLDEPLNGLDPTSAIRIRNLLIEMYKKGTTILLSSHNLSEIDRVTSHILFLKNGRLIREDLSQYESVAYKLTVKQPEQAINTLKKFKLEPGKVEGNKIVICMNNTSLNKLFHLLHSHKIDIVDIEKIIIGSEERYQMIFGKKDVTV